MDERFIDIERLVKWLHNNTEYIYDDAYTGLNKNRFIHTNSAKGWKRYERVPGKKFLSDINNILKKQQEKIFTEINIIELLLCVNNTKDVYKNQKETTIKSTGKKVMILLLLGRVLDGNMKNQESFFKLTNNKQEKALWEYLHSFNGSECFYYLPGRTVSVSQLKRAGKKYKNGIKETAIPLGLKNLVDVGLVQCVDEENELYKLDFDGCQKFLNECTKTNNEEV